MQSSFQEYILDELGGLEDVRSRPMFGGFGLYQAKSSSVSSTGTAYISRRVRRAERITKSMGWSLSVLMKSKQ